MSNVPQNKNTEITKLLNAVKNGDKSKMDELFTETYNHFYGYALIKIWDKTKAEDAVMAMYENVMKYIDSFDASKNGMGWMFIILKRIIISLNTEDSAARQYEQSIDDVYLAEIDKVYEIMGMSAAISHIDEIDKKIVFMYFFERFTLTEIAEKLGCSVSAVHKRKEQAIKILKKFSESV